MSVSTYQHTFPEIQTNRLDNIGNILPDTTAAPALQEKQKELDKHMRMNSLEQKLQNRPKPEELVKDGILEADENPIQD